MPVWIRTLAFVMLLSTSGAFQAAASTWEAYASASEEAQDCNCDREEQQDCDCSTCVVSCGCCPIRLLPSSSGRTDGVGTPSGVVFAPLDEPVVAAGATDIFYPPKA